ncbi:ABC transporter permease [Zhongshania aquimaris]|uniref:FtsX-like permease family protein n=1 Tax=Zhongshania aquimaris TaxID=2857107 RepID=A0ABS6VM60_9GAMM|nr:FtsX-like permease family protein [Zhongshania aquimaris]MBW2939387.1 FtsX-like permease family protein [Zhongshania aquimaris]
MIVRGMRHLIRAWRGGELGLLGFSLALAVAIVSGIAGFSDRLSRGMEQQSHHFLAADRVLKTSRTVPDVWLSTAKDFGLRTAKLASFQSMVYAGDDAMQLASIKAVSDDYPLLGNVGVSVELFGAADMRSSGPKSGELWMDSRLYALLDLPVGGEAAVGEKSFVATQALISEPDQGNMNEMLAPRGMINFADLAATGVVQPGSLVQYRYLFAGTEEQLARFEQWLEPQLEEGQRWQDVRDGQPAMAATLKRAEGFLLLAASLGVALAGAAIALAARRYGERNTDNVAIMKALGASRRQVLSHYVTQLTLLCAAAILVGGTAGYGLQWALFASLKEFISVDIPVASWRPLIVGAVTAFACTAVFAMPPVFALSKVSPLRVLRRSDEDSSAGLLASALIGVGGLGLLMWWYSDDVFMSAAVLLATLATGVLASALVLFAISFARRSFLERAAGALRIALAAIYRRRVGNAFQVASFALSLMVLSSLGLLRTSLLEDWQLQLPADAPNHFLINIQSSEIAALESFFKQNALKDAGLFPMVRGRLTHIDGQNVSDIKDIEASSGGINRELNLSWAKDLPDDNSLVSGSWWQDLAPSNSAGGDIVPVSVELELAEKLHLKLGSALSFNIGGQELEAQVSSIRRLDWSSMRPNFYFMFPPQSLEVYAGSYITSFYLPADKKALLSDLLRQFPTLTLIEIDGVILQMKAVVSQVSTAIGLVLVLIVVCALLVGVANVLASLDSRLHENAILRTLGASKKLIIRGLMLEFAAVGLLSGLIAAAGSNIALSVLQYWVLDMDVTLHAIVFVFAPVIGVLTMCSLAWLLCRQLVTQPPLVVLRQTR